MGLPESPSHSELARHGPSNERPKCISVQLMRNVGSFAEPGSELRRWAQPSLTHSSRPKFTECLLSARHGVQCCIEDSSASLSAILHEAFPVSLVRRQAVPALSPH